MSNLPFFRNIAVLRNQRDLSQADLGLLIGRSQQAIARWEIGTAQPSTRDIIKMADVFDVSIEVVIGRATVQPRPPTLSEKLLEFKALDEGLPEAAAVDPLTREVFEAYKRDPEHFSKVARGITAVLALQTKGDPVSSNPSSL
jgi:transcriptional regulator with XRE-family HTH domain